MKERDKSAVYSPIVAILGLIVALITFYYSECNEPEHPGINEPDYRNSVRDSMIIGRDRKPGLKAYRGPKPNIRIPPPVNNAPYDIVKLTDLILSNLQLIEDIDVMGPCYKWPGYSYPNNISSIQLHVKYDTNAIRRLIPHLFINYVGLVPGRITQYEIECDSVRLPIGVSIPYLMEHPETQGRQLALKIRYGDMIYQWLRRNLFKAEEARILCSNKGRTESRLITRREKEGIAYVMICYEILEDAYNDLEKTKGKDLEDEKE